MAFFVFASFNHAPKQGKTRCAVADLSRVLVLGVIVDYRVKALVTEDLHGRFCYFNKKSTIIERLREKHSKVHER